LCLVCVEDCPVSVLEELWLFQCHSSTSWQAVSAKARQNCQTNSFNYAIQSSILTNLISRETKEEEYHYSDNLLVTLCKVGFKQAIHFASSLSLSVIAHHTMTAFKICFLKVLESRYFLETGPQTQLALMNNKRRGKSHTN
jgi:hypothetical protein